MKKAYSCWLSLLHWLKLFIHYISKWIFDWFFFNWNFFFRGYSSIIRFDKREIEYPFISLDHTKVKTIQIGRGNTPNDHYWSERVKSIKWPNPMQCCPLHHISHWHRTPASRRHLRSLNHLYFCNILLFQSCIFNDFTIFCKINNFFALRTNYFPFS